MSRLSERLARFDEEMGISTGDKVADALPALPDSPMPTPVHVALVNLMDELLTMGKTASREGGAGFTAMSVALRTMHKMRGSALEALAQVPEDEVRTFLTMMSRKVLDVVNAGHELTAGGVSDDTRADQPPAQGEGLAPGGDADGKVDAL